MDARLKTKKNFEEDFLKKQEEMIANAKISAVSELAGGIAHEINNPLAIIHGRAGMLRKMLEKNQLDTEALIRITESIENTSMRISKIIQGLRHFAQDASTDDFERTPFNTLLEDVLCLCNEKFKKYNIELKVENKTKSVDLSCRSIQLSQSFLSFLHNSFYEVKELPEKWILISAFENEENVFIRFQDSGKGIPKDVQDRIFQPFFTTKPIGTGAGIGLSAAKGIIESHKGTIELEKESPYTSFLVSLPKLKEGV